VKQKRLGRTEGPDHDVLPPREVEDRFGVHDEPVGCHRVQVDVRFGALKRPRRVVDLRAVEPASILCVQAITLRQEVLERPGARSLRIADAAVRAAERRALVPNRLVEDAPRAPFLERSRGMLTTEGSQLTASMYRDIKTGAPVEADHVIGDLLARGDASKVPVPKLRTM